MSFVPLGMTQHVFVELLLGEYLLARVAAASIRLALALDALFRVAFEALRELLNVARGAGMATKASESPISCLTCRILPLRYRKSLFPEPCAAY